MPTGRVLPRTALAAALALLLVTTTAAENWPRFRGPNGTGVSADKDVPTKWEEGGFLWKVALPGLGNSSPVVWGDRLFVLASPRGGKERQLVCLSASTGKLLWARSVKGRSAKTHNKNTLASSTPATDGER